MCATDRSQPIRTGEGAGLFSTRRFGMGYGRSENPMLTWNPPYCSFSSKIDPIGGNAVRWSQAVGRPVASRAAFTYCADGAWK